MGRKGSGKSMGLAERARRLRRRVEWTAVILTLLSIPALWFLFQQTESAAVSHLIMPTTRADSPPQAPETAQSSRGGDVGAARSDPRPDGCDDLRVLVDRTHALPADYAPDDLVPLQPLGIPALGQTKLLRREAAEHLRHLVASAAAAGEELTVTSAYRSYADQRLSYARLVSIYGRNAAKTSAAPGHSQHQLGTAVDFTNGAVGYEVRKSFGRTTAYRWLQSHAPQYGFVLAYPPGKEAETGYRWEPWHYRYIGVDNARRVQESRLGLQGFLLQEGITPRC